MNIFGVPVWILVVVAALAVAIYWFLIRPRMEQAQANDREAMMTNDVTRWVNKALENYRPTVGIDNPAAEANEVVVLLKANGELHIRTKNPGTSVRHLRDFRVAVTQGHENLGDSSKMIYVADSLVKAQIPRSARGRIGFSSLIKPTEALKSA